MRKEGGKRSTRNMNVFRLPYKFPLSYLFKPISHCRPKFARFRYELTIDTWYNGCSTIPIGVFRKVGISAVFLNFCNKSSVSGCGICLGSSVLCNRRRSMTDLQFPPVVTWKDMGKCVPNQIFPPPQRKLIFYASRSFYGSGLLSRMWFL